MAVEALSVCASKICMQAVKEAHKQKKLDTNKNVLRMKRVTDWLYTVNRDIALQVREVVRERA